MPRTRLRRLLSRPALVTALAASSALLLTPSTASASGAGVVAEADRYAALGDSYSAGNGAYSTNLDFRCGRNTYAYPYLVARERPDTELEFVACQGATTDDIPGQAEHLDAGTDYVSVTIGGNDIGFADLILNCAGRWSPRCDAAIDSADHKIANELPGKLDKAYATIAAGAPNAEVVVLGYARFFGEDVSCSAADGVEPGEATELNALTERLDAVVADRAAAAGFTYRSTLKPFTGHDVCADDPWLNGRSWSIADGYHPSRSGYANGLAPEVRAVIG